jgi:hypothetical protein
MLNAKSITYPPEGATGIHLVKMFERLGIANEMKATALKGTHLVVRELE